MLKPNRALSQRVFFSHIIQAADARPKPGDYIAHRLKVAGAEEPIFTSSGHARPVYRARPGETRG
ncbi:MAG: hypothetical protein MZV70_19010 [Desulfobacterales bacterium]|nr:hypothetical protein [Desulfobacterales bacterium]